MKPSSAKHSAANATDAYPGALANIILRNIFLALILCSFGYLNGQEVDTIALKKKMQEEVSMLLKEDVYELPGNKISSFDLRLLKGGTLYSESLSGKPTLLNIWFTTCAPCLQEIPILNELKSHFVDSVNFVAITYEELPEVAAFLQQQPFNFEHVIDSKSYIKRLGVKLYPKTLILDKDLIVQYVQGISKDIEAHKRDLQSKLEELLER